MPWHAVEFASLDFEATGLDFARDRIISFGVVPIRGGRVEVGEAAYQLVDPGDRPPSRESVTIHGLRPVDLRGAPTVAAARQALREALDGRFLVTWWAGVEAAFLDNLYGGGARSWMRRSVDVRKLVLALGGEQAARLTLTEAAARYGVPVASPHHALDDALVTAQLFLVTATHMAAQGKKTVADLLEAGLVRPPVLVRPRAPG
ncbi:MAG: 3'-5' exonuclease [Actinobacteria bacterium]|nr:3'-5' exonuclease [Actinomycetota bacterium]